MKKPFISKNHKQSAIVSGFAIVIMAIAAVVANDVTIRSLIVEDSATETLTHILSSKTKFNIGVISWIVILICDLIVAWGLYLFFEPVSKNLSMLAAWFRLAYVAMLAVSILNLIYAQVIILPIDSSSVEGSGQVANNLMFYLDAFDTMWAISLIVFGIHILLIGYLAFKSEHVPKILGILMMIAFIGYTIPKISNLLFPGYKDFMRSIEAVFLIPMLSEVALGIWLLVIGFKRKHLVLT